MAECKYCKTQLPEDHAAIICQALEDAVTWERLESINTSYSVSEGAQISLNNGKYAILVARKMRPDIEEMEDGYYGGGVEYPQGTEFEVFVVLEVGGRYFKKTGTADSYGEVNWYNGELKEVKPEIKTVKVWK